MDTLWTVLIGSVIILGARILAHLLKFRGYFELIGVPKVKETTYRLHQVVFHDFDVTCMHKYGRVWGKYEGVAPHVFIVEPELLKDVLVKRFESFVERQYFPMEDKHRSLVDARSDAWKTMRKALTPTFTSGKLKNMFLNMHNVADEFIDAIQERLETNEVVDMKPLFQALSLDTIANCAFGVHTNSFKHPNNALFKRCQDLFSDMRVKNATESSLIFLGSYFPKIMEWIDLFGLENFEYLFDTTKDIALKRQEPRGDFVDKLKEMKSECDKGKGDLNEDQIFAQGVGFFQAGFETSSNTMTTLMYSFAKNPKVQELAYQEVTEVLKDTKGVVDYEAISKMTYLEAVIKENLRLNPPVIRIDRTCMKDTIIGGEKTPSLKLKKGTVVQIPIYAIHRNPDFFPDPDTFRPERFLEKDESVAEMTFQAFGGGPRVCIGMRFAMSEMKIALAKLISRFKITDSPQTKLTLLPGDPFFLAYPEMKVRLERR